MQQVPQHIPCQVSPLRCSINSAEPCMLMPPWQEGSRQQQRRWWLQTRPDDPQQGSDDHSTLRSTSGNACCLLIYSRCCKEATGKEGNPADEEAAVQSDYLSVGAWVRAPPNVHLQGWDPAQGSLEQCCTGAAGETGGGEPMLRVLACTSAGYVPTQGLVTHIMSSSGSGASNSCGGSDRNSMTLEEHLSSTRLDCSSANDGTELFKVTVQLPSHELASHGARPRLLQLELWQGHLLLSSSVLLLLPPYLPTTAAELRSLPWGSEDKDDTALSFVTDLGLWLEHNELMSRGQAPESSQEAQVCSEPWHTGSLLLRQSVLWAMPALGELLLESLVTLPCAPLSPFAHLAHAHPPQCCGGSRGKLASRRSASQRHCPLPSKHLLSSKHTVNSASAPTLSAEWGVAGAEAAAFSQGPSDGAQGAAEHNVHSKHSARRSSESASSWSSLKDRRDGLLHLALLSPKPIDMMMYLLFWGRRWGDLGYVGNKSKGSLETGRQNGGTNGAPACLLPPCGFVWRFDELNSDGLTPFDILGSLPCAPQMLRIMLDEPAEGFSLLKDAAKLSQLRSTSTSEYPASSMSTLITASHFRGEPLPETQASDSDNNSRSHSPQLQEQVLLVGTGTSTSEGSMGSSSEDMDVLPSLTRRKSLSYDGAEERRKELLNTPLLSVKEPKAVPSNASQPATQLTSSQVLETFARAGMVPATAAAAAQNGLERHSVVECVPVSN